MTYKRAYRFSALQRYCLAAMLFLPSLGKAAVEGIPCAPEPTNMVITYGDVVNCDIDQNGDLDRFQFSGNAGETIRVQTSKLGGDGIPFVEVFAPDGTRICSALNPANCQLTQGGGHAILVSAFGNNQTVGYALTLERIVPLSATARPIDHGQVLSDEINGVGDIDAFVFGGEANDLVRVQTSKLGGDGIPFVEVFAPDGTRICSALNPANCQLTQGGGHTILVSAFGNNNTVQYSLILECLVGVCPDPPGPRLVNPTGPIACTGSRCLPRVICNLPEDEGASCTNRFDLFAFVRRGSGRLSDDTSVKAPRMIRFAFGTSSIPPGQDANVRLKLTKRGKKIARMGARRLRGVFEIRNTPGAVINSTPVKIRIRRR